MQTNSDPAALVRAQWELRAAQSGTQLSGVLFQGFSENANAAMHSWHEWVVSEALLQRLPKGARLLDLGCGYGRLSKIVTIRRPDIAIVGQDMSSAYCRLFKEEIGGCVCASANALPFASQSFDGVMAVTCLMYGARPEIPEVISGLRQILRPGGMLLLLDPSSGLQRLIAALRGTRHRSRTGGQGFSRSEYPRFVQECGFRIGAMGGNPRLSLALLTPGVARSNHALVQHILNRGVLGDCRERGFSRLALHRWIVAARQG